MIRPRVVSLVLCALGLIGCQHSETSSVSESAFHSGSQGQGKPAETHDTVPANDAIAVLLDAKRIYLDRASGSPTVTVTQPGNAAPGPFYKYGAEIKFSVRQTVADASEKYFPEFNSVSNLNNTEIIDLFERAKAGDSDALRLYSLHIIFRGVQLGMPSDGRTIVKWAAQNLKDMARKGDPDIQTAVGAIYTLGAGVVAVNNKLAVKWFREAAEQGHAPAMSELARHYMAGSGTPKDEALAIDWLGRAFELGDARALYFTALREVSASSGEAEIDRAIGLIRQAADNGYAPAQLTLGAYLLASVPTDEQRDIALQLILQAANYGYSRAQHKLATLYQKGVGVTADKNKAMTAFYRAALQGHADSQYQLADEASFQKKYDAARKWLYRASKGRHLDARNRLGAMHEFGYGAPKDPIVARTWYLLGSDLDDPLDSPDVVRISSRLSRRNIMVSNSFIAPCLILNDRPRGPNCRVQIVDGRPVAPSSKVAETMRIPGRMEIYLD